jgi:hypothetical protein
MTRDEYIREIEETSTACDGETPPPNIKCKYIGNPKWCGACLRWLVYIMEGK